MHVHCGMDLFVVTVPYKKHATPESDSGLTSTCPIRLSDWLARVAPALPITGCTRPMSMGPTRPLPAQGITPGYQLAPKMFIILSSRTDEMCI